MKTVSKILGWILLCFVGAAAIGIFLYTLILGVKNYSPMYGIFGSEFVGLDNFAEIFSSVYLGRIFLNTAVISILSCVVGAVYVFLGVCAAGSVKNNALKALLTVVFVLPAVIPGNLFTVFIPAEFLIKPSFLLRLYVASADALKLAALLVPAAVFVKENALTTALKCALMFIGIKLICFLTVDTTDLYNPATYEVLDTFSNFVYRKGLMESSFSYSAAVYIIRVIFGVIPAAAGCVILICSGRIKANENGIQRAYPAAAAAIVPAALLVLTIIFGSAGAEGMTSLFKYPYMLNGIIQALISALLVSSVAALIASGSDDLGGAGIAIIALLCLISDNITGSYLFIRQIGLFNSHIGVILENLRLIPVMTLIFVCIMKCSNGRVSGPAVFVIGVGLMFAMFWGDTLSANVILTDRSKYPISLAVRQIIIQGQNMPEAMAPLAALPYILVPVVIAGAAIAAGVAINKYKDNKRLLDL